MGVEGIYLSMILSRVIVCICGEYKTHIIGKYFHFTTTTKDISKDVLYYALPLIPSTFITSFLLTSNRLFIENFVSMHANGIYAVSYRFNMVIGAFALVFYQTWQESAILQYDSKDKNEFFSKVFNYFLIILTFVLISCTFVLKMNSWLIADEYIEAFKYLYIIGIAQFFSSLSSSFFELGYQCSKETYREIYSVLLALVINIVLCYLFAERYGIYGVIFSNIIAYIVLALYRYFDTKRYFTIKIKNNTLFIVPIIIVGGILFNMNYGRLFDIISLIILLVSLSMITSRELKMSVLNIIKKIVPFELLTRTKR